MKTNRNVNRKVNYIVAVTAMAVLLAANALLAYMVALPAAGTATIIAIIMTAIPAFVLSVLSCMVFARRENAHSNTLALCFKRMYLPIVLLFLGSVAVSFAGGMIVNAAVGGLRSRIDNPFLRGFMLKGPMFLIYLGFLYKFFVKQGYLDSSHKCFNPEFKIITFLYSFMFMLPNMVFDSMYDTFSLDVLSVNVHTVFSPNIDLYAENALLNSSFNLPLVIISVAAVLLAELAVILFAYGRGRKHLINDRTNTTYATDEYVTANW